MTTTNRRRADVAALLSALLLAAPGSACADVVYEVGSGQTYTTIVAAITDYLAVTNNPLLEPHVINIHAGVYTNFLNVDHSGASRTTITNRLIIQAVPGDEVVIRNQLVLKESHVTVRGIKFAGLGLLLTGEYITMFSAAAPAGEYYGGLLVYNCEFEGRKDIEMTAPVGRTNLENGVSFDFALINNYVHDFLILSQQGGQGAGMQLVAGNVYYNWNANGTNGTGAIFAPMGNRGVSNSYLNNTLVTTDGRMQGALNMSPGDAVFTNVLVANNIIMQTRTSLWHSLDAGYYEQDHTNSTAVHPQFANNLHYGVVATNRWAYEAGGEFSMSFAQWTNHLAEAGQTETGALLADPEFASDTDLRLKYSSPAAGTGDPRYFVAATNAMGLGPLIGDYWNPRRDIGFDRTFRNIGALDALPAAGTVVQVR